MSYRKEKSNIIKVTKGGDCYYLTVKLFIHPLSSRIVYFANKYNIHPNYISFTCGLFSFLCLYLLYRNFFWLAFLLFYIRMVLDYADGALARYSHKTSKLGSIFDRLIDEAFFLPLWIIIALKTKYLPLGFYFLISVLIYRIVVDLYIYPKLKFLKKRAAIKQFFIDRGIILGFGTFTVIEFWSLFILALASNPYFLIIPIFLCNLDLTYRLYEIIKYGKSSG